jgi:Domain of unknown function (DUF4440)
MFEFRKSLFYFRCFKIIILFKFAFKIIYMKSILTVTLFLIASHVFAQSEAEAEILQLSKQIFNWEVENKTDSLENLFDEKLMVVSSAGETKNKEQYLATLRSGNFVHNSIDVEESVAVVVNNTAMIVGKGRFAVTVSTNKVTLRLSYTEVFTRPDQNKPWKILAIHASKL